MNKLKQPLSIKESVEDLHSIWKKGDRQPLLQRTQEFSHLLAHLKQNREHTYARIVTTPAGREVGVWDAYTGKQRKMLMFASNNYLGLANHPYIKEKVNRAIKDYGVGVGGPPLLNGYTKLMRELEERLAAFKHQEDAMIFSTGFQANLGLIGGLVKENDRIVFDRLSHASFYDALRLSHGKAVEFEHNDLEDLEHQLKQLPKDTVNRFVGVEGVYSMDGDLAPLDQIIPICRKYDAYLLLDDAHGTGVLGAATGSGTAEHFGLEDQIDVSMGTFSKVFSVTGGFLAASKELIDYLRYFARTYMFSASLTPMTLAAVLAGLDMIEREPERRSRLLEITEYAKERLRTFGFSAEPEAGIIALKVPPSINIRKAAYQIHERGIFLNAIEFPAVSIDQQRFRISMMSEHTKEDVDRLAGCLEEVWAIQLERID